MQHCAAEKAVRISLVRDAQPCSIVSLYQECLAGIPEGGEWLKITVLQQHNAEKEQAKQELSTHRPPV